MVLSLIKNVVGLLYILKSIITNVPWLKYIVFTQNFCTKNLCETISHIHITFWTSSSPKNMWTDYILLAKLFYEYFMNIFLNWYIVIFTSLFWTIYSSKKWCENDYYVVILHYFWTKILVQKYCRMTIILSKQVYHCLFVPFEFH